jgi:hypothetical protein
MHRLPANQNGESPGTELLRHGGEDLSADAAPKRQ